MSFARWHFLGKMSVECFRPAAGTCGSKLAHCRPILRLTLTLNLRQSCIQHYSNHPYLSPHAGCHQLSELLSNQKRLPLAEVAGYAERSENKCESWSYT